MSATLHLPLDYEQLPEMWQLKELLQTANLKPAGDSKPERLTHKQIESAASWIFHRLFVALGYQARSNNRPGFLSSAGAAQLRGSFEPFFGDDCNVIELLEGGGSPAPLLKPVEGGWICELFALNNPHLAGNFKPGHVTGNVNSRVAAAYKTIVHTASQQAMLLGDMLPGILKRHDGEPLVGRSIESCIVLVRTLDRCLRNPAAHDKNASFTEGIFAAASKVTEKYKPEQLMPFYYWLANHVENPVLPKTSEEILADFEKFYSMMGR